MKKKKITRKKYATGTAVKNYMQNPSTELAKNQINMAKAQQQVGRNDLTNFMSLLGNMGMQVGMGMEGFNDVGGENLGAAMKMGIPLLGNMKFAMGGQVQNVPVEVEGGEMAETPDGEVLDFEGGPSHEKGGIKIDLPEGTEVFSDRIEIFGETPAERKRIREAKEEEVELLLEKTPGDKILLNTLKRIQESNAEEEAYDQEIQQMVAEAQEQEQARNEEAEMQEPDIEQPEMQEGEAPEEDIGEEMMGDEQFAYGTKKGGIRKKYINGTGKEGIKRLMGFDFGAAGPYSDAQTGKVVGDTGGLNMNLPNLTPGDITGLMGTLYSTFSPMQNTLEQRAGDTPNINAFEGYGENALSEMDNAMGMLAGQQEKALQDLELNRNTSMRSNRNTARGVNTMRSLDLGVDEAINQASGDIYSNFANQVMSLMTQKAGMMNQQDQMRMTGEQARDTADREDRGGFYTQLGADKAAKGAGIQTLGKLLNQNKVNSVTENALNNMSKYGLRYRDDGVLVDSTGIPVSDSDKEKFARSQNYPNFASWLKDNQNRI